MRPVRPAEELVIFQRILDWPDDSPVTLHGVIGSNKLNLLKLGTLSNAQFSKIIGALLLAILAFEIDTREG
jgi:hypothetical protein